MPPLRSRPSRASRSNEPSLAEVWPWWQLVVVKGGRVELKGRSRALLSRHVINLRVSATRPTRKPVSSVESVGQPSQSLGGVNFVLGHEFRGTYSLVELLDSLLQRWPGFERLALVTLLEVATWLLDMVWLTSLKMFLRLSAEAYAIMAAVWVDVREFGRLIGLILSLPLRPLARMSGAAASSSYGMPRRLVGQLLIFLGLALCLALPVKVIATWQGLVSQGNRVLSLAQSGLGDFKQGGTLLQQGSAGTAEAQFAQAQVAFGQAIEVLDQVPEQLTQLLGKLPGELGGLTSAQALLEASRELSLGAEVAARTLANLSQAGSAAVSDFSPSLIELEQAAVEVKQHVAAALAHLALVKPDSLPPELTQTVISVQENAERLTQVLDSLLSVPTVLKQALVTSEPRTYVVLFQNTTELRPTGGFAGSLALIEVSQGQVKRVEIPGGGPYDFQGSLKTAIKPPDPIRLVRGSWQLQDANWFFDFPTSAREVLWFLQESGGPQAHGVVALNSDVVIELLKLTGPLEMAEYGKVITAENFMRETQAAVELEYERAENRPKQFIADLAPALLGRLLELPPAEALELTRMIDAGLRDRGIQLYLTDETLEARLIDYGWAGQVQASSSDYLAIVRANIGGGKTDAAIEERARHRVEVSSQGELTVTLELTRDHQGDPYDIWEQRRNVSYLRFYVPLGATLLATDGFTPPPSSYYQPVPAEAESDPYLADVEHEVAWQAASGTRITTEFGKTVFGNWLSLSPGETRTVSLTYRLPFRLVPGATWQDLRRYSVLFQRQSGVQPMDFSSNLVLPTNFKLRWQESSGSLLRTPDGVGFQNPWKQDEYYGVVLENID